LIASYQRDFGGGHSPGGFTRCWDWPTFSLNSPERYERAKELLELMKTLPE